MRILMLVTTASLCLLAAVAGGEQAERGGRDQHLDAHELESPCFPAGAGWPAVRQ